MIKVDKIEPVDIASRRIYKTLKDLENDYLKKFRVYTKPEELLQNFIDNQQYDGYSIQSVAESDILVYLNANFPDIITGLPQNLKSIINHFNHQGWSILIYDNDKTTDFGKKILEIFGYKDRFRTNVNRGIWLAKQLNVKTCPYCNAQYTIITSGKGSNAVAKFQFDHFFPKSIYPYLSISLYNLIPSCASCNITKSKKTLNLQDHYHPYFSDIANRSLFRLKYDPDPAKLTIATAKNQNLEIEFVSKYPDHLKIIQNHDLIYDISGIYDRHRDVAEELLITAVIYTNGLINSHLKIDGLFSDINDYRRFLIRNYAIHGDILKRPLSKFMQDIARQLKLI